MMGTEVLPVQTTAADSESDGPIRRVLWLPCFRITVIRPVQITILSGTRPVFSTTAISHQSP
jgi:hypothetical protein